MKKWTSILQREYTPFITTCITDEFRKRFSEYVFRMDEDGVVSFSIDKNEAIEESKDFCIREKENLKKVASEDVRLGIRERRNPESGILELKNIWKNWKWYDENVYTLYEEVAKFCDASHRFKPKDLKELEEKISKIFSYYAYIGNTVTLTSYAEDAVKKFYNDSATIKFGKKTAKLMKDKVRMDRESITVAPEAPFADPYLLELDKLTDEAKRSDVFLTYVREFEDLLDKEQNKCIEAGEKSDTYKIISRSYLTLELARRLFEDKYMGKKIRNLIKRYSWLYTGIGIVKGQENTPETVSKQVARCLLGWAEESQKLPFASPEIAFKKNARDIEYSERIRLREIIDRSTEERFLDEILPFAEIVLINGATRFERRCLLSKLFYSTFNIFKLILDKYSKGHGMDLYKELEERLKRKRPKEKFRNEEEAIFRILGFLTKNEILCMLEDLKGIKDYEYDRDFFESRMELWVRHYVKGRDEPLVDEVGENAKKYLLDLGIEEKIDEKPLKGIPTGPLWVDDKRKPKKLVGFAKVVRKFSDLADLKNDNILVAVMATPEYIPHFSKIKGIVVEDPSITSHSVLMGVRYDVPILTGVKDATKKIHDSDFLIIDGMTGKISILSEDQPVSLKRWKEWRVLG